MKTWSDASGQGANLIFKPGQEMEIFKPNTDGVSRFRPIARPYPEFIRALVPEFLPKAQELSSTLNPATSQYRQQLEMLAREFCASKGLTDFRIVDAEQDLANATRQALSAGGTVPTMEWWRHGPGSTDIGAWALSLDVAGYWGVKSISILDHTRPDPAATAEERNCESRETKGVFRKVYDELTAAAKNDPRWNQYVKVYKQNSHGADRPSRAALMQVFLYEQNGRAAPQPVRCMFMINPMTLKSLEAQWNMPASGMGSGAPADFLNGFQCGNLLDPERGCMITAYDQTSMQSQQSGGAFGGSFGSSKGGGGGQRTNYVATLQPGQPLPNEISINSFRHWDDLLWLPTRKEAWMKVLDSMGEHATAYAGRHEIPLLPATLRQLAHKYAQGEMGGGYETAVQSMGGDPFGGPPAAAPGGPPPAGFGAPPAMAVAPGAPGAPPAMVIPGGVIPATQGMPPAMSAPFAPPAPAAAPAPAGDIPGAPVAPPFQAPSEPAAEAGSMVPPPLAAPSAPEAPAGKSPDLMNAIASMGQKLDAAYANSEAPASPTPPPPFPQQ